MVYNQLIKFKNKNDMTLQVHSFFRHPFFKCAQVIGEVIGGYLDTDSVLAMASVCKQWNEFLKGETDEGVPNGALAVKTSALRKYVQQHGFGANKWKHYFGEVERIRQPLELLDILKSQCPFFPGKEVGETHYLFLLPKTVDEKPLTLNNLEELVKNPKEGSGGNPSQYRYFYGEVKNQYGNQETGASRWALMTRDVIPGSRNKSSVEQRGLIRRAQGYEIPESLTAAVGVFLRYVATGERLLSDAPWTYTRCQEPIRMGGEVCRVVIGNFSAFGFYVEFNHDCGINEVGVTPVRKFFGPPPLQLD